MSIKAVSLAFRVKAPLEKANELLADRQMWVSGSIYLLRSLLTLICAAVISGDTLVLRGRPGPQGQAPKERCVYSVHLKFPEH
jgi:hypothetical protein